MQIKGITAGVHPYRAGAGRDRGGSEAGIKEMEQVNELKARDREVRQHEAAHKAAAGQFAGGAHFTYVVGPDGRRYAVGGEVSVDISAVPGDPDATIQKMQTIARAALAPRAPSSQDRAVAAQARAIAATARAEKLSEEIKEKQAESRGEPSSAQSTAQSPSTDPGSILDLLA